MTELAFSHLFLYVIGKPRVQNFEPLHQKHPLFLNVARIFALIYTDNKNAL